MQEFFLSSWETLFCRNLKGAKCHFWADVMSSEHLGPLQLQSCNIWGWFNSKNFSRAIFYVFWGTCLVDVFLSYLSVKQIWRKSSVRMLYSVVDEWWNYIVHLRWIYLTTRFKYHFSLENYFAETLRWWRNVSFHLEKRCHLPCQPVNPSLHALKKFPDDHRWRKLLL